MTLPSSAQVAPHMTITISGMSPAPMVIENVKSFVLAADDGQEGAPIVAKGEREAIASLIAGVLLSARKQLGDGVVNQIVRSSKRQSVGNIIDISKRARR